jgi:phosphate ABC transporter phosphate-binding protein
MLSIAAARSLSAIRTAPKLQGERLVSVLVLLAVALILGPLATTARGEWESARDDIRLQGAGATFPQPLYERWVVEFQKRSPTVQISYQGGGSGAGIRAITDKTVAFAASDAPLTKKELEAVGGNDAVLEFPTVAGAVVPAYNVPGVSEPIKFTGEILADIYLGRISKWNDPKIAALNEKLTLPDLAISPVYRSDGSGTTAVFTSYLAGLSESFKGTVGMGKQVRWPIGVGGKGNPGVAAAVQQSPGALGYIEYNYALENQISFGSVKNAAGVFVLASPDAVTAAGARGVAGFKAGRLVSDLWNQPGESTYPISSFTYILVYRDLATNLKSEDEAKALASFLMWAVTDGQALASELHYAPLSPEVRAKVVEALATLNYKGKPVTTAPVAPAAPAKPSEKAPQPKGS